MNHLLTLSQDAAERLSNLSGVEIAFEYTDDNDEDDDDEEDEDEDDEEENEEEDEDGDDDDPDDPRQPVMITREQIMQLLGHAGLGRIFATDFIPRSGLRRRRLDDDEQGDEEDSNAGTGYDPIGTRSSGRRRGPRGRDLFEKVPSEQGQELMQGGNFGTNPRSEDTLQRKKKLAYNIMRRELGIGGDGRQKNSTRLLRQDMIPESVADTIIHYNARCYSGQFSDDGNFFFSCAQDFKVRMYDTSNPYDWKYYKVSNIIYLKLCKADSWQTVRYDGGQWTITDASLSPDNRFLAYSSIRSIVALAHTDPDNDSDPHYLDFSDLGRPAPRGFRGYFGVSYSHLRLNFATNYFRFGRYDSLAMAVRL